MKITFGPSIKDKIYLTPQKKDWYAQTIAGGNDITIESNTYIDLSPFQNIYCRLYGYIWNTKKLDIAIEGEYKFYFYCVRSSFNHIWDLNNPEQRKQYIRKRYSREKTEQGFVYFLTQEYSRMYVVTEKIYRQEIGLYDGKLGSGMEDE